VIKPRTAKDGTKTYGVRIHRGGRKYEWVGTFRTRKEARKAEAAALNGGGSATTSITCGEWADRWFGRYERDRKDSSADTARSALKRFRHDFADRPLDAITRIEAMDWADEHPHRVPIVITMMNAAVDAELLDRNPFRGLQRTTRGRSDQAPPTMEELDRIEQACAVHGSYAAQMRALILFAAYSGMRPGELFVLEHADIDTEAMRVDVRRRLYRGRVDLPKSNKTRRIALNRRRETRCLSSRTAPGSCSYPRSVSGSRSPRCRATGARCSPAQGSTSTSTSPPSTGASATSTPTWAYPRG
jgi:integrase